MELPDLSQIERVFRECSGRAVATLTRRFRDLSLAEELVQEAFVQALDHWPNEGLPPHPDGWIITTAARRGLDRLRRESSREQRHGTSVQRYGPDEPNDLDEGPMLDDQLRLIFTCCHPSLAPSAQVALTLRLIAGLQTDEIARAFLVPETTMAQRLVRAKNKIRDARSRTESRRMKSSTISNTSRRWVSANLINISRHSSTPMPVHAALRASDTLHGYLVSKFQTLMNHDIAFFRAWPLPPAVRQTRRGPARTRKTCLPGRSMPQWAG